MDPVDALLPGRTGLAADDPPEDPAAGRPRGPPRPALRWLRLLKLLLTVALLALTLVQAL